MQDRVLARRILRWTSLLTITFFALIILFGWVGSRHITDEEYAVYSSYLSDNLLNDAHDWSVGGPIQVVIADHTVPGGDTRIRPLYLLDGRVQFDQLRLSTKASYLFHNLFSAPITPRFSLPHRATVTITHK